MKNLWKDESGVLTFEWILLITLLVIGIVGGMAVMRDAYISEAADTAGAILALDTGYTVPGSTKTVTVATQAEYSQSSFSYTAMYTQNKISYK